MTEKLWNEGEQNAAWLREARYSADLTEFWAEFGVCCRRHPGRCSVLTGAAGSSGEIVVCFPDKGETAADAECWGFAQLACTTGITVVCVERDQFTCVSKLLAELEQDGLKACRVFAFGKGDGGKAAAQWAISGSTAVSGVCAAFSREAFSDFKTDEGVRKLPLLLLDRAKQRERGESDRLAGLLRSVSGIQADFAQEATLSAVERALGVEVHRGYHVMLECAIWRVADWYDKRGALSARIIEGLDIPQKITGAAAPLAYHFFRLAGRRNTEFRVNRSFREERNNNG